jgi:ankyrin repeat protein
MRTFQQQYQQRQSTYNPSYATKKAPYPNKPINDIVKKEFLGTIITANLGEIKKYLDTNTLQINSIKDESEKSILHLILEVDNNKLSENEKLDICTYLVSKGANFHAVDKNGNTPIHIAAQRQYSSILDLFIESKCNINVVNFNGQNALHLAVQPIVKFCPRYKPLDLIPSPDVKTRDINDINIGIMQHLRDFFKVSDLPKIVQGSPGVLLDKEHYPLLYPLLAIKNLISKSDIYLKNKNKDFFKTKNTDLFKNIKNELSKPNYTDKDRQLKIKELLTLNVKSIVTELNEYYKNAKENIKFDNTKAFADDSLVYYATDNTSTVFNNRNKNLTSYFEDAFNDVDGKYNTLMVILNDELKALMRNIDNLEKNVSQMDDFNAYYGDDLTFGYHELLTDKTKKMFETKYGMKIKDIENKSAFEIFFSQKNRDNKIIIKNRLPISSTEIVNMNGVNIYKQIKTNDLFVGCGQKKIIDSIELKINGVRQITNTSINEIEFTDTSVFDKSKPPIKTRSFKLTVRIGSDIKNLTFTTQDNLTFMDKDDAYYDVIAGKIKDKITLIDITTNPGLLRHEILNKQEIKNKIIEKFYGISDTVKNIAKESSNLLSYIPLSDNKTFNEIIDDFINPGEMARKIIEYLLKILEDIKKDSFIKNNQNRQQVINFIALYDNLNQIKTNGRFDYNVLNLILTIDVFGYVDNIGNIIVANNLGGAGDINAVITSLRTQIIAANYNYNPPESILTKGNKVIDFLANLRIWLLDNANGEITKINTLLGHDEINYPAINPVWAYPNPGGVGVNAVPVPVTKIGQFKTYINTNQYTLSSLNDLLKYSNEFDKKLQDLTQKINQYIPQEHPTELVDQIIKLIDEFNNNRYKFSELLTKLGIIKSFFTAPAGGVVNSFIAVMNKLYQAYVDNDEKKIDIIDGYKNNIKLAINNVTPHINRLINELISNSTTRIMPRLMCLKDNLVDLNNILLILKTYDLYGDYYDFLKDILIIAFDIRKTQPPPHGTIQNDIKTKLIELYQNRIVFKLLDKNTRKKINYTSSSVLSSFFKNYLKSGLIDEVIKPILSLFDFNKYDKNKYDYYTMYNLLHGLNFSIIEYVSYLLFILKNEKNNLTNLRKYQESFEGSCNFSINFEDIVYRTESFNGNDLELNIKKINTSINEIISVLNFHQNLVISNTLINKLYTGGNKYFDKENYKIKYKKIIENKFGKKNYNIQGIFNQNMQQLPTIDWENAKIIDPDFFKQAYPSVENMIFYTKTEGKTINDGNFIVLVEDPPKPPNPPIPQEYVTIKKNGLLLYTPKYKDNPRITSYRTFLTDPTKAIGFQSLTNEKINDPINDGTSIRYDKMVNDTGIIGIIGVEDINNPALKIDLLDFNLTNLPFDLTNSYFSILTNKIVIPNIELITNLKRIFIAMVLDTRKLPIYTYSSKSINNIPGPNFTIKPDKNVSTVYGYDASVPNNLFDFVKDIVTKQLSDLDSANPQIKMVTNHLIAEGIDTILSKNIENYYNSIAYNVQQKILNEESIVDKSKEFDLPVVAEKPFKIDFVETNEKLFEIMTGQNYYSTEYDNYPLVDLDMVLMEMSKDEIEIDTFTSKMPLGKNTDNELTVYFKPEYNKTDLSILQKDTVQCIMNSSKIINNLIKGGIHLNHQDLWGKTPIQYAIEIKDVSMVQELLKVSNLNIRNLQNMNLLQFSLASESFHQKLLIDNNHLAYGKKYELTMDNIFMTNDELKRNMPKHIKLINYLPILLLNNVWYKMINSADKITLQELFYKYRGISDADKNNYKTDGLTNFMFSNNALNANLDIQIQKFKNDLGFSFEGILEKFIKIIDKYNKLLSEVDNSYDIAKLQEKKKKYEDKLAEFKNKVEKPTIPKYNKLDDLISTTVFNTVFDQFDGLQDGANRPELTHYIFAELLETYVNDKDLLFRGENIHLYLSTVYSEIISVKKNKETLDDLKKIDKILDKICNYLDQRYMENSTVENNVILDNIVNSITYSSLITLQNNYLLDIKKVLTKHIITNYGIDQLDEKCKNVLKELIDGILKFKINGANNLTIEYVKLMLGVKNITGYENVEYNKLDNYMNEIKTYFMSNIHVPISDQSTFMKNLEIISNYYKTLYNKMVDHQINLILNYIKFIINQSKGLKILISILEKS